MALHDLDKQSHDRANPKLNADDNVANRMAHKTLGTTYKTTGNPDANRLIFDKGSVKGVDQDGNNNLFLGYDPAVDTIPVLKIAAEGYDISTASTQNIPFDSSRNTFEVVLAGQITAPAITITSAVNNYAGSTGTVATLAHGLDGSFIPVVLGTAYTADGPVSTPYTYQGSVGSTSYARFTIVVTADATNIKAFIKGFCFNIPGGESLGPVNINYYVLRQQAPSA